MDSRIQCCAYKGLLKKYMSVVIDCENISFIDKSGNHHNSPKLHAEEIKALELIEKEIRGKGY